MSEDVVVGSTSSISIIATKGAIPSSDIAWRISGSGRPVTKSAVISVPRDANHPVHIYHASFQEFLLQPPTAPQSEITDLLFGVPQHERLAQFCLIHMRAVLKQNICEVPPSVPLHEIGDLKDRLDQFLLHETRYACLYTVDHLRSSRSVDSLRVALEAWLREKLLFWFEVLSLMGELSAAHAMLCDCQAWYETFDTEVEDCTELLNDGKQLVSAFFEAISLDFRHIYRSSIPFVPPKSQMARSYGYLNDGVEVIFGAAEKWQTQRLWVASTLDLGGDVRCIIYSPDGLHIATGMDDGSLHLWHAQIGKRAHTFIKHSDSVICLAFLPDGMHLVSSSNSELSIQAVGRARRSVNTVAGGGIFALMGNVIAYAATEPTRQSTKTVRIWDAQESTFLRILRFETSLPASMQRTKYMSEDNTHDLTDLCFSPNGDYLLEARHLDGTLLIVWDWEQGTIINVFHSQHSFGSIQLFKPTGTPLDTTVLWIVHEVEVTYEALDLLTLPKESSDTDPVASVRKFHDLYMDYMGPFFDNPTVETIPRFGRRDVRSYRLTGGDLIGLSSGFTSLAWYVSANSPDGSSVAVGALNDTLELHSRTSSASASPLETLFGHVISSDGSLLAVTRGDQLLVYNLKSGNVVWHLQGTSDIRWVHFLDNMRIICEYRYGVIRVYDEIGQTVWEASISSHLSDHGNHSDEVWTVVSPDGRRILRAANLLKGPSFKPLSQDPIILIDLSSEPSLQILQDSPQLLTSEPKAIVKIGFSPDSSRVGVIWWPSHATVWSLQSPHQRYSHGLFPLGDRQLYANNPELYYRNGSWELWEINTEISSLDLGVHLLHFSDWEGVEADTPHYLGRKAFGLDLSLAGDSQRTDSFRSFVFVAVATSHLTSHKSPDKNGETSADSGSLSEDSGSSSDRPGRDGLEPYIFRDRSKLELRWNPDKAFGWRENDCMVSYRGKVLFCIPPSHRVRLEPDVLTPLSLGANRVLLGGADPIVVDFSRIMI